MNKPAAMDMQVVDIKNDPQHKGFIRVTSHVPIERGAELTAALGWPTYTSPVPVAVAVLDLNAGVTGPAREVENQQTALSAGAVGSASRLTRTAGMLCNDPVFRKFLDEHGMLVKDTKEDAAMAVRLICEVKSRKDIVPGTYSGDKWDALYSKFIAWREAPEAGVQAS